MTCIALFRPSVTSIIAQRKPTEATRRVVHDNHAAVPAKLAHLALPVVVKPDQRFIPIPPGQRCSRECIDCGVRWDVFIWRRLAISLSILLGTFNLVGGSLGRP